MSHKAETPSMFEGIKVFRTWTSKVVGKNITFMNVVSKMPQREAPFLP